LQASTVGGGGVGSGLKAASLKSVTGANNRGKGGKRGRQAKQDVSRIYLLGFLTCCFSNSMIYLA
jgi:hypothetical protein